MFEGSLKKKELIEIEILLEKKNLECKSDWSK